MFVCWNFCPYWADFPPYHNRSLDVAFEGLIDQQSVTDDLEPRRWGQTANISFLMWGFEAIETKRKLKLYMYCRYEYTKPCMINRIWGLKQLWLQVNGHATAPLTCSERGGSEKFKMKIHVSSGIRTHTTPVHDRKCRALDRSAMRAWWWSVV